MNKKLTIIIVVLIGLVLLGSLFYWYQIRPANIKHDCSWVKVHNDVWPGITQEEIDIDKKKLADCELKHPNPNPNNIFKLNPNCPDFGHALEKARDTVPASDYYRKASENEYKFCLHDKGL